MLNLQTRKRAELVPLATDNRQWPVSHFRYENVPLAQEGSDKLEEDL